MGVPWSKQQLICARALKYLILKRACFQPCLEDRVASLKLRLGRLVTLLRRLSWKSVLVCHHVPPPGQDCTWVTPATKWPTNILMAESLEYEAFAILSDKPRSPRDSLPPVISELNYIHLHWCLLSGYTTGILESLSIASTLRLKWPPLHSCRCGSCADSMGVSLTPLSEEWAREFSAQVMLSRESEDTPVGRTPRQFRA